MKRLVTKLVETFKEHQLNFAIKGIHRLELWLLLIVLTLSILLFPTHLTLEYYPIQSIPAITSLPFFATLFCIWLLVLLLLLFSEREVGSWEKPALVVIFALVFIGFWLVTGPNTEFRYDGLINAAYPKYLLAEGTGKMPVGHPNLGYFYFPGMHLLALSLLQITGLTISQTVTLSLVFHLLLFSVLLYILFLKTLESPSFAAFGAILVLQGNMMLARYSFFPGIWALVFLMIFLFLLSIRGQALFETWQGRVLMLIMLAAITVTHLVTSITFFFILAGIYLVQRLYLLRGKPTKTLVEPLTLALVLIVPIAWELYWATQFFETITKVTAHILQDLGELGVLTYVLHMGQAYVGGQVPLWAVITRYFWWVVLFLFGTILALKKLLRIKTLDPNEKIETGELLGVMALTAAVTLGSPGGSEYYRFLLYGAFFTVPIILRFLLNLSSNNRRLSLTLLIIVFSILSFPTFLAHNNLVGTSTYYPSELQAGSFLERSYGKGEELAIFYSSGESGLLLFSVPDAYFRAAGEASHFKDKNDFWQSMNQLVDAFGGSSAANYKVCYLSKKIMVLSQHFFGVTLEDPNWQKLKDRLSYKDKIYDNGDVQL
ncbi:MAG: hypothetical protein PHN78_04000, partial [Dehalococcoidales bacterium]|nr:hypothetical protein [Dehalococcoidales bacterium]